MARRSEGLSDRHRKIMQFLEKFQEENGYSPSIREIGDYIGVKSTSLVDYYLNQLEDRGHISRDMRVSRSIRVLKGLQPAANAVTRAVRAATEVFSVPLVGRIVASSPIPMPPSDLSYFDPDSSIEIAVSMLPGRERKEDLFALEVQGDSMIDAMVFDGDIVIMKLAHEARNGEMVAFWFFFFQAEDGIRDLTVTGSSDVCSSDLDFSGTGFCIYIKVSSPVTVFH